MKSGKGHVRHLTAAPRETGGNKNTDIFWTPFSELLKNACETLCWLMNLIFLCVPGKKPSGLSLMRNWRWWLQRCGGSSAAWLPVLPQPTTHSARVLKIPKVRKSLSVELPQMQPSLPFYRNFVAFLSSLQQGHSGNISDLLSCSLKRHTAAGETLTCWGNRGLQLYYMSSAERPVGNFGFYLVLMPLISLCFLLLGWHCLQTWFLAGALLTCFGELGCFGFCMWRKDGSQALKLFV